MSLSQIVDQLLVEVKQESESSSGLSDELLSALQAVFGSPLLHALAILEVEDSVILYTCPAGRSVYQVCSSARGQRYQCLSSSNYCSCPSFIYNVILRQDSVFCKHQLAVHLANAMNRFTTVQLSDTELTQMLSTK